jgi:hypothetical protein
MDATVESVKAAAALAGLELSDERAARLLPQLQAVLSALESPELGRELAGIEPATTFSLEAYAPGRADG